MDRQFLELLPWYANGTLPDAERTRVDEVLRSDVRAATELAWLQGLQQRVHHARRAAVAGQGGGGRS